jgi:MFS family permease
MTDGARQRWVVLGAAFVVITLSIGTLFTLGVFLKPIEDPLGWSRSSIGAVGFLNWFVMGLGGVAAGYLSDRFGTRAAGSPPRSCRPATASASSPSRRCPAGSSTSSSGEWRS